MSTNGQSSSPGPFVVEEWAEGRTLVVTGPWSDETEAALASPTIDGLELNYARGYRERDLEFLKDFSVRRLLVLDHRVTDLSPVERLSSLEEVRVETASAASVDLRELPHVTTVAGDWPQVRDTVADAKSLRRLIAGGYDGKNTQGFVELESLAELELQGAPRLDSLAGADRLRSLSALHICQDVRECPLTSTRLPP